MTYNYKYKMEWVGLKYANYKLQHPLADTIYYRLEFYKNEVNPVTYDVITLQATTAPFTLRYYTKSDYIFEPFRSSSAEINILQNQSSLVSPSEFFIDVNNDTFKVVLKLINETDATETELWKGVILNDDIQYDWQDIYQLRLIASDNIGILKEFKYSDPSLYMMYKSADLINNISIKDFIIRGLNYIGLELNTKFALNLYNNTDAKNEDSIFLSEYSAIDWSKKTPYDIQKLIGDLLTSLGCILYQDNRDATWTILSINEVATSTNNEVAYRLYNYLGAEISTGNYNISGTINLGEDAIWSDTNQIVTLRQRFDSVQLKYPYIKKNLVQNYSFFKDTLSSTDFNYWDAVSGYAASIATSVGLEYSPRALRLQEREDKLYAVNGTKFVDTYVDFTYYAIRDFTFSLFSAIVINFDYKFISGHTDDGFNVSFYSFRLGSGDYVTFNENGDWATNTSSDLTRNDPVRIPVYPSKIGDWGNFNAVSKYYYEWFEKLNLFNFKVRGIRTDAGETPEALVTNVNINVVPFFLTLVNRFVYLSTQRYNQSQTKPTYQLNSKIIDGKYHTGRYDEFSAVLFDDCLTTIYNNGINDFIMSNQLWTRNWESHTESDFSALQALTAASILSFHREVGRVFRGNVFAEQTPIDTLTTTPFCFPMYLEIGSTYDEQGNSELYSAFNIRVTNDGGTIEDTNCGSDFLNEFNQINSKFLMQDATFDYYTNKTNVTLQEDFTDVLETFSTGIGQNESGTTSNIGEAGSNSGNTQTTITTG